MALTDEQRSMLQLLLGGQSYADIASLLGVGPDEVRSRARAALQEVGGADPDAQVSLSDFLLGQADPIGRADAVRHLQSDPDANALATNLVAQLRLLAPRAELPEIPAPRGRGARPPSPPRVPTPPTGPPGSPPVPAEAPAPAARQSLASRIGGALRGVGSTKRSSQLAIGLGALGLLVVVGALAIAGVFGGDGDSGGSSEETTASVPDDSALTVVRLAPLQGDGGATGQAVFAQAGDQPVLQINLSGLPQAGEDQTYIVWLYNSDQAAFPLARDQVGQNGNLTGAAAIPQELLPLLSQFGCVDVSLASNSATQEALQQAVEGQTLPQHSGESVLRGQVPSGPGEQAPTGAESQCGGTPPAPSGGDGGADGGGAGGGESGQ
jgi:hypothetical protein